MPDARCTRSRLCSKKHRRQQLQVHRNNRHSLRNGFNGFLRALPGDRAWLPPSPVRRESVFTTLAPALERQNHTTSPSAQTPFVRAIIALGDVRPSHPIPNVRDDREPPLYGGTRQAKEATDLGVRSIAADRDRLARRAKSADEACILRHTTARHVFRFVSVGSFRPASLVLNYCCLITLASNRVINFEKPIESAALQRRLRAKLMSQPKTIRDIIENLEEQKRLFEILLAGGRGLSREVFQGLLTTIMSANDRTQVLLDSVVRHDAVLAAGSIAASRKLN